MVKFGEFWAKARLLIARRIETADKYMTVAEKKESLDGKHETSDRLLP
jgi:hypothetical protein